MPQEPVHHGQAQASVAYAVSLGDDSPIQRLTDHLDLYADVKMEGALQAEGEVMSPPRPLGRPATDPVTDKKSQPMVEGHCVLSWASTVF